MKFQSIDLPSSGLCARVRSLDAQVGGRITAVFLYGLGCAAGVWPLRGPLPPGFAAAYLDLPGHGRARISLEPVLPSIAEQVKRAVDELGIDRTFLVGHSMGGLVALHLESLLGERNLRTLLFCTGARFANITESLHALRHGNSSWVHDAIVPRLFAGETSSPLARRAAANTYQAGRTTMIAGLEALERYDAVVELPPLRPIRRVLFYGTNDRMVIPSESLRLARRIGAEAVALPGVGHFPMVERPDVFRRLLHQALQPAGTMGELHAGLEAFAPRLSGCVGGRAPRGG